MERGGRELGGQAIPVRLHSASEPVVPRAWPEPQNPLARPQTSQTGQKPRVKGGASEGVLHASWPTCVDAHVVLVVGGTREAAATVGLGAGVGPLARVGAHVYLADIGCGEGAAAALEGAPERAFTCGGWRVGCGQEGGTLGQWPGQRQAPDRLPVWVRTCFCRSPEVLKALLHSSSGHLYGFSPVWVRTWLFSP